MGSYPGSLGMMLSEPWPRRVGGRRARGQLLRGAPLPKDPVRRTPPALLAQGPGWLLSSRGMLLGNGSVDITVSALSSPRESKGGQCQRWGEVGRSQMGEGAGWGGGG